MNIRRAAGAAFDVIILAFGVVLAAVWLGIVGFYALLMGAFGGVGGWAWAIGYVAVGFAFIVSFWPFRWRRYVVGTAAIISIAGGLWLAHVWTYTTGRVEQMVSRLPTPPNSTLVAMETDNNCFGSCPEVKRFFVVQAHNSIAQDYGQFLLLDGFHRVTWAGSWSPPETIYQRGRLIIGLQEIAIANDPGWMPGGSTHIKAPTMWTPDTSGNVTAPSGSVFFVVHASVAGG